MRKHLFDDLNGDAKAPAAAATPKANGTILAPGERPPYDPDAT